MKQTGIYCLDIKNGAKLMKNVSVIRYFAYQNMKDTKAGIRTE